MFRTGRRLGPPTSQSEVWWAGLGAYPPRYACGVAGGLLSGKNPVERSDDRLDDDLGKAVICQGAVFCAQAAEAAEQIQYGSAHCERNQKSTSFHFFSRCERSGESRRIT